MTKELLDPGTNWLFKPFNSNKDEIYYNSLCQFVNRLIIRLVQHTELTVCRLQSDNAVSF